MLNQYTHQVLRFRWLTVLVSAVLIAVAGYGIQFLHFKSDYRMFFSDDNPQLMAFESLNKTYVKDDNILMVVTPANGDVFTKENLVIAEKLTKRLWQTPYSIRVDSITNFQHSHATGDDLFVEDLVRNADQLTVTEIEQRRRIALNEPLLVNRLISPNSKVMGFNIVVHRPGLDQDMETVEAIEFTRGLVDELKRDHADLDVRLTGSLIMDISFAESSKQDMSTLTPAMLTIICIALWLFLKSAWGTLAIVMMMTMAVSAAVGLAGWMDIAFSPSSIPAPTILLTVVVADAVHILTSYYSALARGQARQEAMIESIRINFKAVFFTNLTTAVGFLSMNYSEVPPFQDLGNITAMGVGVAFLLTITFLPAVMMLLPMHQGRAEISGSKTLARLAQFIIAHRTATLSSLILGTIVLIACIPLNTLDDEYVKYFDDSVAFRRDTDYTTSHLTGVYRIDYSLGREIDGGISDPEFLQQVDAFVQWYREQPEVMHVYSATDILKRLNRNMHQDDPAWYRLPDTQELSAQILLMYEMSLPYGLDLNDRINVGKSATRVTVTLHSISSQQVIDLETRAQAWLAANTTAMKHNDGTGPTLLFAHIGQRNITSMIAGELVAIGIISLILIFVLRSVGLGLISLIPNLVPAGMAFGLWGLIVGQVGLAASVVAAMTLGILVDDTVHFLSKYQYARKQLNLEPEQSIQYAFATVGSALWITSAVLIMGFSLFTFSSFKINHEMGLLTAAIFALGLFAEFLLLPPILLALESWKRRIVLPSKPVVTKLGEIK
ncbi:MMPL family transporter [Nitrosomonas sp.]|uniref:efflux RND transporter permease subunit n=1 Tax=Nitrosomonas sp. TaxID=42353 RepID=UPI002625BC3C|nr:MMPL family transporter [Nitrosomonas sp.]